MKANDKNHLQWAAELGRLVVTGEAAALALLARLEHGIPQPGNKHN